MRQHRSTAEKERQGRVTACSASQTDRATSVQNPAVRSPSEFQLLTKYFIAVVTSDSVELCASKRASWRIVVYDIPTRLERRNRRLFAGEYEAAQKHRREDALGLCYGIFALQHDDGRMQTDGVTICPIYDDAKCDIEYAPLDNKAVQIPISADRFVSKRLTEKSSFRPKVGCNMHHSTQRANFRRAVLMGCQLFA